MRVLPTLALSSAVLCLSSSAFAWATAECLNSKFHVHKDIAAHVLDHPTIAPLLAPLGLSRDAIVQGAGIEPQCTLPEHPAGWTEIVNQTYLAWPLNDTYAGILLHLAGDSGVPINHCPACEVFEDKSTGQPPESKMEAEGELITVPPLTTLYTGTYAMQLDAFHTEQVAVASDYKAYWDTHSCPLPVLCDISPFAERGSDCGQKLGQAVFLNWLLANTPDGGFPEAGTADAVAEAEAGAETSSETGIDAPSEAPVGPETSLDSPPTQDTAPDVLATKDAAAEPKDPTDSAEPQPDSAAPLLEEPQTTDSGCSCTTAASTAQYASPWILALALGAALRRRRSKTR